MDVYSGALYIVARLTRHSRGKTWLQNRILDTAALRDQQLLIPVLHSPSGPVTVFHSGLKLESLE